MTVTFSEVPVGTVLENCDPRYKGKFVLVCAHTKIDKRYRGTQVHKVYYRNHRGTLTTIKLTDIYPQGTKACRRYRVANEDDTWVYRQAHGEHEPLDVVSSGDDELDAMLGAQPAEKPAPWTPPEIEPVRPMLEPLPEYKPKGD